MLKVLVLITCLGFLIFPSQEAHSTSSLEVLRKKFQSVVTQFTERCAQTLQNPIPTTDNLNDLPVVNSEKKGASTKGNKIEMVGSIGPGIPETALAGGVNYVAKVSVQDFSARDIQSFLFLQRLYKNIQPFLNKRDFTILYDGHVFTVLYPGTRFLTVVLDTLKDERKKKIKEGAFVTPNDVTNPLRFLDYSSQFPPPTILERAKIFMRYHILFVSRSDEPENAFLHFKNFWQLIPSYLLVPGSLVTHIQKKISYLLFLYTDASDNLYTDASDNDEVKNRILDEMQLHLFNLEQLALGLATVVAADASSVTKVEKMVETIKHFQSISTQLYRDFTKYIGPERIFTALGNLETLERTFLERHLMGKYGGGFENNRRAIEKLSLDLWISLFAPPPEEIEEVREKIFPANEKSNKKTQSINSAN